MPLTSLATQSSLQWVSDVTSVGLFQNGPEVTGGLYARQPVTFGSVSSGSRLSQQVLTFTLSGAVTVYTYGLFNGSGVLLARMPNCSGASNPPQPCYFIDTTTGWIDAPGHTLAARQHIFLISGQESQTNTFLSSQFNPFIAQGITYSSLPAYMAQQYGPLYPWYVAEVATDRFRIMLYEDYPYGIFVSGSGGWGFYQRVDPATFQNGGTLRIDSIRVTEFG